jgi:hypothetical protein
VLLAASVTQTTAGGGCVGAGAYSDLKGRARLAVSDAGGTALAVGELKGGLIRQDGGCGFAFVVPVPAGIGFYSVEVGQHGKQPLLEGALTQPLNLPLGPQQ